MRHIAVVTATLMLTCGAAIADDRTVEAAIGGAIGGAAGAALGSELGGREGAILGGALGAATGAAVTTGDDHRGNRTVIRERVSHEHGHGRGFCPPGQAKKGRC